MLSREDDIEIIFAVSSMGELIHSLNYFEIDILILDLNLEDTKGLNTLETIHQIFPNLKILILTSATEKLYAINSLKNGAMGYLEKSIFSDEIIKAIREINDGRVYITESFKETILNLEDIKRTDKRLLDKFSKREFEIISMLCQGLSSKEIASNLSISQKTVATYKRRIVDKLNLSSSRDLIKFLYDNNLCQYL